MRLSMRCVSLCCECVFVCTCVYQYASSFFHSARACMRIIRMYAAHACAGCVSLLQCLYLCECVYIRCYCCMVPLAVQSFSFNERDVICCGVCALLA